MATPKGLNLKTVPISRLVPGQMVHEALYHVSATPVLVKGQRLGPEHLLALKAASIGELYECRSEAEVASLAAATTKECVPLCQLMVGMPVPYNIYNENGFFLLRKGAVLGPVQHQRLTAANIDRVYVDDAPSRQAINSYVLELTRARASVIEQKLTRESSLQVAEGASVLPHLYARRPQVPRPAGKIGECAGKRREHVTRTASLLHELKQAKSIAASEVGHVALSLQNELISDLNLALNLAHDKDRGTGQFQQHTANVATLSLGIGLALGYTESSLMDLGQAALLHEVGMLGVAPHLLSKKTPLSASELAELRHHPVLALNFLEQASGISERVIMAVYQEHEAPNRSGYPNQRPSFLIHDFSKIISLCDAYEAMTAPRPFREAFLPYNAVASLIKATTEQRFDQKIMRAFLQVMGLFPVGSWVQLSNDRFAKVVANNPEQYDRPTVNMLFDKDCQPLPVPEMADLSKRTEIKVLDVADESRFPGAREMGF